MAWLSTDQPHPPEVGEEQPIATSTSAAQTFAEAGAFSKEAYTEAMTVLAHKLPDIEVARGLSLLQGDARKYLRLLHRFVSSHGDDPAQLAHHLANDDRVGARRVLHTLKGTAGTLGIDSVAVTTRRLEQLLRSDGDANALSKSTHQELDHLRALFATLAANLPALGSLTPIRTPANHEPSQRPVALNVILTELGMLLARNDTAAINFLEEHEAAVRGALGPVYEKMSGYVGQFDFEAALGAMSER